jgi:hypothetical protein
MSATELTPRGLRGGSAAELARRWRALVHLPGVMGAGLLAIILYAAFAYGAVSRADETRIELCVAGLAILGLLGLWTGTLRLRSSRLAWVGAALLTGFACWSGVTLVWSVAPDQTWIEVNRVITYTVVLLLGLAVGSSYEGAVSFIARGFLGVALIVTAYAIGQKLFPGLHVSGVFNLNQTGTLTRVQEPLGYWNALALFIALGTPLALSLAVDRTQSGRARLLAAGALQVMLVTIPFTYSRGGLLALAVALTIGVALSGDRLRSAVWLALTVLSALPAILVGLLAHRLSSSNVPLGARESAGAILALVLAGCLLALGFAARWLMPREVRIQIDPARVPVVRRSGLGLAALLVGGGLLAVALSSRGLGGTLSQLWHGFSNTSVAGTNNPNRLLSAVSHDRWVWWKEAVKAFSARPWGGWGAGSFPVVHLLYRTDLLPVQQPHEVPLQFLAETGVVGGLLGVGGFVVLLTAATRSVRRRLPGRGRLLAAGLAAAAFAYAIHCLYDWDWNIPALSLAAFLFLGVAAARRDPSLFHRASSQGSFTRALWLGVATFWLCVFAVSVEVPELAASKASAALVNGAKRSPASLRAAQAEASSASRLDPLSDAGPLAQATLALHVHDLPLARTYLRDAVAREPTDPQAWQLLALVDGHMGQVAGARLAVQRAIDLDPMGRYAQGLVTRQLTRAPPSASATRNP